MKCPRCHSDNPDASRFCGSCAASLSPEEQESPFFTKTIGPAGPAPGEGKVFANRYRISGEIGRGGMGIVLKAEDTKLKRSVALKILPFELSQSSEAKRRFIREAQAAAALDHPNICTIYEVDEHEGQAYIAMALIEGVSLKQRIAEGGLEVCDILALSAQIAAGLEEAHRKGVVHRDIKPANIMLTPKGQAKVMDFGLAHLSGSGDITRADAVMGTVAYMSPEQALGKKADRRTDIWSFGCLLYEMLAGDRAFHGAHDHAVIQAIIHGNPQPITSLKGGIPVRLDRILTKCLQKDPADRYPDFTRVLEDLKAVDLGDVSPVSSVAPLKKIPSIAVLPFADMSPDKDQDYFAEGIAEELINALAHLQDLRVVARTSAFALKGLNLDIREIGRKLDVKAVLEGSVRKAGNRLRVTAQLISVEDGFHLWSERYDREMSDIFAIQDDITAAIVDSLKVTLKVGEKTALRKRSTTDPEAYSHYLKGLYFYARPSIESYEKAMSHFRAAIDKDPNFALSYAGIAGVYSALGIMNLAPPVEMWPKAKAALQKSLLLDEDLAEAHAVAAGLAFWYEWDWEAAGRSFDRVLALNPGDAMTHGTRGWFLLNRRRFEESIREIKKALEIDPLMPLYYSWSVGLHWSAGRIDEAMSEFAKALEIDPNNGLAYFHGGVAYYLKGFLDEAAEIFEKGKRLFAPPGWMEAMLGLICVKRGDPEEAARILEKTIEAKKTVKAVSAMSIAWLAGELGKLDLAFELMNKAYEERDILIGFVHVYAEIFSTSITADPRFKDFLARLKLDF